MKKTKSIIIIAFLSVLLLSHNINAQEIFDAIRNGDIAKVKELVEKDPQLLNARNTRQSTPLHVAVDVNNEEIVCYLIDRGADINAINASSWTPLYYAKKLEMAKLLVEKGAEINSVGSPFTPLSISVFQKRKEVAEYLVEKGAELPEIGTELSLIMLRESLKSGGSILLDKYVSQGFDPLYENELKNNLLHFAAERGSVELIERLIHLKIPITESDIFGYTPLHVAALNGNTPIVKFFIKNGADINVRTKDGNTPYNLAVAAKRGETAEYLKSMDADQSPQKFPVLMGEYLGQPKPGKKAVPFAPGIVGTRYQQTYHSAMVLTPDGNEMYWSAYIGEEVTTSILMAKRVDGKWTKPEIFAEGDVPFISPDGKKIFFVRRTQNEGPNREIIYVRDKTASGWSEPQELPEIINSTPGIHWQVSVDEKGNIYFGARAAGTSEARIYYSEFRNGDYSQPRIVEGLENTDAHSPYIAPDGSFLIISKSDGLNILFRISDGSWTKEKKLVDRLGVAGECPAITPDGRYLFFIQTIPYWVDASFIEELRQKS